MDAIYFLKKRTSFIRFYYDEGAKPFRDIQQKIELGHYPFDDPPYSEDEPAFVEQWDDAETGVAVLGHSCVYAPWYRGLFPGMRSAKDSGTELVTSQGGSRYATSSGPCPAE